MGPFSLGYLQINLRSQVNPVISPIQTSSLVSGITREDRVDVYLSCFRQNGFPRPTEEFVHGWGHHVLHEDLDGTMGTNREGVWSRRQKSAGAHVFVFMRFRYYRHHSLRVCRVAEYFESFEMCFYKNQFTKVIFAVKYK